MKLICICQLRHPNLLAFKDAAEVEEKGAIVVYLVTEPVKPLKNVLDDLSLSGEHRYIPVLLCTKQFYCSASSYSH